MAPNPKNTIKLIAATILLLLNVTLAQEISEKQKYREYLQAGNMYYNEACVNSLSLIDVKNFDLAKSYYLKALKIRDNDPYSLKKIEKIKKIFLKYKSKMERAYIRNIRDGERFIKQKKFAIAKGHFSNAIDIKTTMGITPDNASYPDGMLEIIDLMIEEEKNRLIREEYLKTAEHMIAEKKYYEARSRLQKNNILYPHDQQFQKLLTNNEAIIDDYENKLQTAENFYSSRQFDSSKVYYEKAYEIYPHQARDVRFDTIKGKNQQQKESTTQSVSSFQSLSLIPGYGQFREKRYLAGITYSTVFVVTLDWLLYANIEHQDAEDEYDDLANKYSGQLLESQQKFVQTRVDAYKKKKYMAAATFAYSIFLNSFDAYGPAEYIPGNYHFANGRESEGWLLSSLFTGSTFLYIYAVNDGTEDKAWGRDTGDMEMLQNAALGVWCSTIIYNIWDIWRSGNYSKPGAALRRSTNTAFRPCSGITSSGTPSLGLQFNW